MTRTKTLAATWAACLAIAAGCASITSIGLPSPEAQITAGAQAGAAATVTTTELLASHRISVSQAESFRAIAGAGRDSLKRADADLVACRKETGSDETTRPDPCWARVSDVVRIALESITSVKRAVDARK